MEEIPQNLVMDIHWIHDKTTFPHWTDIRQNTSVHSLYWIQEGEGAFRTEKAEHLVSPDMLFYLRPGLSMEMSSGGLEPLRITMILLSLYTLSPSAHNQGRVQPLHTLPLPFLMTPGGERGEHWASCSAGLPPAGCPEAPEARSGRRRCSISLYMNYFKLRIAAIPTGDRGMSCLCG